MTHFAPAPPGEMPVPPQRTRRPFEKPPPGSPEAEATHTPPAAPERVSRVQAWCVGGAVALILGGGILATVLLVRERAARRRGAAAVQGKQDEGIFADFHDPVELPPRRTPTPASP